MAVLFDARPEVVWEADVVGDLCHDGLDSDGRKVHAVTPADQLSVVDGQCLAVVDGLFRRYGFNLKHAWEWGAPG